jgi:ubiquinone/menaquinone biosynthesis C-methylase UbiE
MSQEEERQMLSLLRRNGYKSFEQKRVLEIGCGSGYWLREFVKWGAWPENLTGVDLLADRLVKAKKLCPEKIKLQCGNAAKLNFPDSTFDLVLQATVFTSIMDLGLKQEMASEMMRVVKGDGLILWYDYFLNNPSNPDVRGVKKKEIYRLFEGCRIELQKITLAPPIVRLVAPYSWSLCYFLQKIPWLCTFYLGAIRKGKSNSGGLND